MKLLSVLTTNVFPDRRGLEITLKSLKAQTWTDFEWILLDGFHNANADYIEEETNGTFASVLHAPLCMNTSISRRFVWEPYNNALLLAKHDKFFRIGTFRWLHRRTLEMVMELEEQGFHADMIQHYTQMGIPEILSHSPEELDELFGLDPEANQEHKQMFCHAGMFSFSREKMISFNGNNEAAELLVHHEDLDLNARWSNQADHTKSIDRCMMRIRHNKGAITFIPKLEEGLKMPCTDLSCCVGASKNPYHVHRDLADGAIRFVHDGFDWAKCPKCGVISPMDTDEYLVHIRDKYQAPIGVDGRVGRNIKTLWEDIRSITDLSQKLNLLRDSHTNERYLT